MIFNQDEMYRMLANIVGSPGYWMEQRKNLLAMMRQLGVPTLFLTFSSCFFYWTELIYLLLESEKIQVSEAEVFEMIQNHPDKVANLINEQPVLTNYYFHSRFDLFFKNLILYQNGIFSDHQVKDFYYRVEFTKKGNPHIHMVLWLENVPLLVDGLVNDEKICKFIEKYIECEDFSQCPTY